MAIEVKEIDQIINAMRDIKREHEWPSFINRFAELAERIVDLEDDNAALKKIALKDESKKEEAEAQLEVMTQLRNLSAERENALIGERDSERTGAACQRDRLVEQLAELTMSRDYHLAESICVTEEMERWKKRRVALSSGSQTKEIETLKLDRDGALNHVDVEIGRNKPLREQITTLKQRAKDREHKFNLARNALTSSMLATDQVATALGVLGE